jgi:lipid-binding SYLF domain-containing protein
MKRFPLLPSIGFALVAAVIALTMAPQRVVAATADEIDRDAAFALENLYKSSPAAQAVAKSAVGVLVFPHIVKAGFLIGGQYGDGVLRKHGTPVAYYNTAGASYGLQAGAQSYGYALFFMNEAALRYLDQSDGWEIGVGPSVVIVDEGMAKSLTTTTAQHDIYAFIFGQHGLMAGLGLQGNKITRVDKR